MPRKTSELKLRDGDCEYLRSLTKQRTIQAQVVIRAHILLDKANDVSIRNIASIYNISTNTVRLCINKYAQGGTDKALFDEQRKGHPVEITDDTVSCDEKPGFQAIQATSEDLRPSPADRDGCVYRDYEYKRLGTLSLLAGIDLLTGQAIPIVSETHKSSDFIRLLKQFDGIYPEGDVIRIICDNHSAHKSKVVRNYLAISTAC